MKIQNVKYGLMSDLNNIGSMSPQEIKTTHSGGLKIDWANVLAYVMIMIMGAMMLLGLFAGLLIP